MGDRFAGIATGSASRSAAFLLAVGLALGGCGAGGVEPATPKAESSDPVVWVGPFCEAMRSVVQEIRAFGARPKDTPQARKDGLIADAERMQQVATVAAGKLEQLGPPRITDGKRIHDATVAYFTIAAAGHAERLAMLVGLDVNDPDFDVKSTSEVGDRNRRAVMPQLYNNEELKPALDTARECTG